MPHLTDKHIKEIFVAYRRYAQTGEAPGGMAETGDAKERERNRIYEMNPI